MSGCDEVVALVASKPLALSDFTTGDRLSGQHQTGSSGVPLDVGPPPWGDRARVGFEGVTSNEVALVAFLLVFVMVAPKVPRIGERLGDWLSRRGRRG